MKTIYFLFKTLLILFTFPFILSAQETVEMSSDVFLFDRFINGKILLTDKSYIETQFNYDCEKQELYYKDGNEYQMMYNTSNIDTLWIGNRKSRLMKVSVSLNVFPLETEYCWSIGK